METNLLYMRLTRLLSFSDYDNKPSHHTLSVHGR